MLSGTPAPSYILQFPALPGHASAGADEDDTEVGENITRLYLET